MNINLLITIQILTIQKNYLMYEDTSCHLKVYNLTLFLWIYGGG